MLFYKNEINGKIAGLTTSPYPLNIENFFEVTEEEYLAIGGILPQEPKPIEPSQTNADTLSVLIDALIK